MLLDREMSFTSKEVQVLQSDTNRQITASIPTVGRIPRSVLISGAVDAIRDLKPIGATCSHYNPAELFVEDAF